VLHMALKARRRCKVIVLKELSSVYTGFVDLELLRMALRTESRDLLSVCGRPRVSGWVYIVRAMTGLACGRHGISHGLDLVMHT